MLSYLPAWSLINCSRKLFVLVWILALALVSGLAVVVVAVAVNVVVVVVRNAIWHSESPGLERSESPIVSNESHWKLSSIYPLAASFTHRLGLISISISISIASSLDPANALAARSGQEEKNFHPTSLIASVYQPTFIIVIWFMAEASWILDSVGPQLVLATEFLSRVFKSSSQRRIPVYLLTRQR